MLIFDSPMKEFCEVRRVRTSTPLQALNLLNDPQMLEAARVLGSKLVEGPISSLEEKITLGLPENYQPAARRSRNRNFITRLQGRI